MEFNRFKTGTQDLKRGLNKVTNKLNRKQVSMITLRETILWWSGGEVSKYTG